MTALKDTSKWKVYDAGGISDILIGDLTVLKNPVLETLATKISKGSIEQAIKLSRADNLLTGLDIYKKETLDGI